VSGGERKIVPVLQAQHGRWVNGLVTDAGITETLLEVAKCAKQPCS